MKLKLMELEAETENSKIGVDFNTLLSKIYRKTINKIIILKLKNIINILDLTPINSRR